MKLFYTFLLLFISTICANAQVKETTKFLPIFLEEFNLWIEPEKLPDTTKNHLDDTTRVTVLLTSPKGTCSVKFYNERGVLTRQGQYIDALDVFKRYIKSFDALGDGHLKIWSYYQPVIDGEWIFYSNDGQIIKKEEYRDGILYIPPVILDGDALPDSIKYYKVKPQIDTVKGID